VAFDWLVRMTAKPPSVGKVLEGMEWGMEGRAEEGSHLDSLWGGY